MQKKWSIVAAGGILAVGAALLVAQNTSWLTGTADQKFDTLANIQPGLGAVMIEYSSRMGNMYYAAQASNWGMAAYQLKEMVEVQEVGETTRPAKGDALRAFEQGALKPLALDIVNQDIKAFAADFNTAAATCNGCRLANAVGYIVFKLPARPK